MPDCEIDRVFRPPAEADSLILRVAYGCPFGSPRGKLVQSFEQKGCTFCAMYKDVPYRERPLPEIRSEIARASRQWPETARVFLADGDVMALPFANLRAVLGELNTALPRLTRVSLYANGLSIATRSDAELCELRKLKLHTLYMGLESGDEETLRRVRKPDSAAVMVEAGRRAQACGLRMSVMILLGVGGRARTTEHAAATAAALNGMQPRLLSALRLIPIRGTPLAREIAAGEFVPLTEAEAVRELRNLIAALALERSVFRANHVSNIVPLEGRLPADRQRLLTELDALLAAGSLDTHGPGPQPVWL